MPSRAAYDASGVEFYTIPSFTFSGGTTLHEVRVAYKSINPAGSATHGTVLIPTCYGGHINTTLTFTEAPCRSLSRYHVVVVAMFGNAESASPSNTAFFPEPGQLRYEDCIRAQHRLLTEHLQVRSLEAVIGFSMGAQQAYHWAVMYPAFVRRAVPICGSARTSPHNYAFLEGPIGALSNSIDFVAYREVQAQVAAGHDVGPRLRALRPERGLRAFGRAYNAWLTSATWFRERWWGRPVAEGGMGMARVEDWIVHASEDGFVRWDPMDLLVLARMWQLADVGAVRPGRERRLELGGPPSDDAAFRQALAGVTARVLVMPCRTDQYFPPEDGEEEVRWLPHARFCPIESVWGHVAGGGMNRADVEWMDQRIADFLAEP